MARKGWTFAMIAAASEVSGGGLFPTGDGLWSEELFAREPESAHPAMIVKRISSNQVFRMKFEFWLILGRATNRSVRMAP